MIPLWRVDKDVALFLYSPGQSSISRLRPWPLEK